LLRNFFKRNNIDDIDRQNQIIVKAHKFLKKYSKTRKRFGVKLNQDNHRYGNINPSEEPIPIHIIEYALKNSLEDLKYRDWIKRSSPSEIKQQIIGQNQVIKTHLSSSYENPNLKFDNNELLYFLELKKLFLNDFHYFQFLKHNYPNQLNFYGKNIFPIIKENQINGHSHQNGHYAYVKANNTSNVKTIRRNEIPNSTKFDHKFKSSYVQNKRYHPTVTVKSEYLGSNQRLGRSYVVKKSDNEYKSSIPFTKKGNVQKEVKVTSTVLKKNNYSLEPKIIRRSHQYLPKKASVKNIIEQRVSRGPKRVVSVNRIRRPVSKKYFSEMNNSRNDQEIVEYRVIN